MNERHKLAAAVLRGGGSQVEAAKVAGVSPRQLRRWLDDVTGFRDAAQPTYTDDALGLLPRDVLRHLLRDPTPMIRLRAAEALTRLEPEAQPERDVRQLVSLFGYCDNCTCERCTNARAGNIPEIPDFTVSGGYEPPDDPDFQRSVEESDPRTPEAKARYAALAGLGLDNDEFAHEQGRHTFTERDIEREDEARREPSAPG